MKKVLIIALTIVAAISTSAQSILGVKVGENYADAKKHLEERFSYRLSENSGNLTLYDFSMGDFGFNYGTLFFQWNNDTAQFYKAVFQKWMPIGDVESIKKCREILREKIESKYSVNEFKNNQGFKCYDFIGEEINGVTMYGSIEVRRTKGNDGTERLYLMLFYEPKANFIIDNSDF